MGRINYWRLFAAIAISEAVGVIGSFFTVSNIPGWYAFLTKPSFSPPNWIFGPVWVTLYGLMGVSLYLIWQIKSHKREKKTALEFFFAQLVLNGLWSFIFFGWHLTFLAFVEIILMFLLVGFTILKFEKLSKLAGYLLIPYILWVGFASVLNFSVWLLN